MARTNTKATTANLKRTHEGAVAKKITPLQELRRTVLSCLLNENTFYEDGVSVSDRIKMQVPKVKAQDVATLAIEARTDYKLRHVPLLLCYIMSHLETHRHVVKNTLAQVIQRPDEISEYLAMHGDYVKKNLTHASRKGIAEAFKKFNEHQLSKYNNLDRKVKLKDALFLSHAKPKDAEQESLWKRLINNELVTPDTWEVNLSVCKTDADKKEVWERLLSEDKLGALALLRNLRNIQSVCVDEKKIKSALRTAKTERVLPFRFITAARYAPKFEPELERLMYSGLEGVEKLNGKTILLIDKSGSMDSTVSAKSDMTRFDAAVGLSILAREICEDVAVYTFNTDVVCVPSRRGFALRDAMGTPSGGTYTGEAVDHINKKEDYDRLIIFTDEQSASPLPAPKGKGYVINVASYQYGIGYGKWVHIDGMSEAVVNYIQEYEQL